MNMEQFVIRNRKSPADSCAAPVSYQNDNHEPMKWASLPNGNVISPNAYEVLKDRPSLKCVVCEENVHFRKNHKRCRNGIQRPVQSHFVHNSSSAHSGESVEHMAAKKAIVNAANPIFRFKCVDCDSYVHIHIPGTPREETTLGNYRLDVGYTDGDNNVVGAVEIYKTHRIGRKKEIFLTESNIAWCEVSAEEVLNKVQQSTCTIDVMQCAISDARCMECAHKIELERKKAEALTAKKEARNAMKAKSFVNHWENATNMSDMEHYELCENLCVLLKERYDITTEVEDVEDRLLEPEGTLTFGKFCGRHIRQLMGDDQESYVRWIAGYTGRRAGKRPQENDSLTKGVTLKLRKIARDYLKGRCLICYENTDEDWKQWCRRCYRNSGEDD